MEVINARQFVNFLIKRMREYSHELNAHRAVLENYKLLLPEKVDEMLEHYRKAPAIQALTEKQFAGLDLIVEQLGEDPQEKALLEFLEKWNPIGEPN